MGRPRMSVRDRITERTSIDPTTGCWNWLGGTNGEGYGRIGVTREHKVHLRMFTHRAAYEEWIGPVPDGLVLDHLCRNTICCNPEHLEPVTQGENIRRGEAPSAKFYGVTHCIDGHEFTPENTYTDPGRAGRYRKACRRRRSRESAQRKKARA